MATGAVYSTPMRRPHKILKGLWLFSLVARTAAAQSGIFTVGTATAAPGQKATGYLEVPAGADPAAHIPVIVIRGAKPGRTLAPVAGLHGTEYASVIALYKLITLVDPRDVSGTLIVLPLVNIPSFEQMVPHVNPVDGKSMNRFYPGRLDGTQTERASFIITREVVERCDDLIDLHGGDLDESLRPYSYWFRSKDPAVDTASRELVVAFGLDHIIIFDDFPKDPGASRYLDATAIVRGKPAIAVEAGFAGTVEPEDVDVLVRGCLSVMRHLRILPGSPTPVEHPVWIAKAVTVTSDEGGVFYPLVGRGTYVEKGMKIGYVTDYFGKTLSETRAPVAGVVLHIRPVPSLRKGDTIIDIGELAPSVP